MKHPLRSLVLALTAFALTFGAVQAFASPSVPQSLKGCNARVCFDACQARYGEGTIGNCTASGACVCIL
jgi:hypothetical protein